MIQSFAELGRFKIVLDESWKQERNRKSEDKIWYETIPCHGKGKIYLKNSNACIAYIPSIGILNNLSAGLTASGITHTIERLDGEGTLCFGIEDFKKAAKVLKARRRRRPLTEEERQMVSERLSPYQFSKRNNDENQGQISTQMTNE